MMHYCSYCDRMVRTRDMRLDFCLEWQTWDNIFGRQSLLPRIRPIC